MNNAIKALIAAAVIAGLAIGFMILNGDDVPTEIRPIENHNEVPLENDTPEDIPTGQPIEVKPLAKIDVDGLAKDGDGKPLSGVVVTVSREGSNMPLMTVSSTDQGSFQLIGLNPGHHLVVGRIAGYQEVRERYLVVDQESVQPLVLTFISGLSISGYVKNEQGQPIKGARVMASREQVSKDAGMLERLMTLPELEKTRSIPMFEGVSDENGYYQVLGLEDDNYRVDCLATEFAPHVLRYVAAGAQNADFILAPGGILTGTIAGPGGPVEGAMVYVRVQGAQGAAVDVVEEVLRRARPPIANRKTDSAGRFTFDELGGDQTYRLLVTAPGFQNADRENVVVQFGQDSVVDFLMNPGLVVSGIVTDPNGAPVPDATVRVTAAAGQPKVQLNLFDDGEMTDQDGRFVYDTLEEGDYRLVVSHDIYAAYSQNKVQPQLNGTGEEMSIQLSFGGTVEGTVRDSVTAAPIAGAEIRITDIPGVHKTGVSNSSGFFSIQGLSEQSHQRESAVTIDATGYARLSNVSVQVIDGQLSAGNDFNLHKNGVISGRVVDNTGKPVSGCRVTAKRQHSPTVPVIINVSSPVQTRSDGTFEIADVAPGEQCFVAGNHSSYLESESEAFDIEPNGVINNIELRMRVGGSIEGFVTNEQNQPIADAIVALQGSGLQNLDAGSQPVNTRTDAQGYYRLTQVDEGTHTLLCEGEGFLEARLEGVDVSEGHLTNNTNFKLVKGSWLSGYVLDGAGKPLHSVRLTVVDTSNGMRKLNGKTDNTGYFHFDNLGPYEVRIDASLKGYSKESQFDVPVNSDRVEFRLLRLGSISGFVLAENQGPLTAFSVQPKLLRDGRELSKYASRTFTKSQGGEFVFGELEPGNYNVFIGAPGYSPSTVENIVVRSDQEARVGNVYLSEGGKIVGYVVDLDGNPVAGARLSIQGVPQTGFIAPGAGQGNVNRGRSNSDREGYFEIIGLSPTVASVTLKVEHANYITETIKHVQVNPQPLEVVLSAGCSLTGQLIDVNGEVAAGRQILLSGRDGVRHSDRAITDRKGFYRFSGLEPGSYELRVHEFGRADGVRKDASGSSAGSLKNAPIFQVTLGAGEARVYDLELQPKGGRR